MEAVTIVSCLLICFLLHLRSVFLVSDAYTLPNRYLINCGSDATVSINGVNFTGDVNPVNSVSVPSSSGSSTAEDRNSSPPNELYRSARVFTKASAYRFEIEDEGIHVVRFHFFPLTSWENISDYRFNVLASGLSLLSNFSIGNRNFSSSPPIEEFLLRIPRETFKIDFVPYSAGLFAFVNAIEVFLAPPELIPVLNDEIPRVTPGGEEKGYTGLRNNILHVIHRINVGGQNVMPSNDTLLRYWIPDDDVGFMINRNAARNSDPYTGSLNYQSDGSTQFIAPDNVYKTAKVMNILLGDDRVNDFNVSWRFGVRRGAEHLVRVHFCDVVTQTSNEFVRFNLYIYSNFSHEIWPFGRYQLATPFYVDYVVKSDDSGFMNISIGPSRSSEVGTAAFLNGVEIMELIGNSSSGPKHTGSAGNRMPLIIGLGVGGGGIIVVALIILAVCLLVSPKKKWKPVEAFEWPLNPIQGASPYSMTTVRTVSSDSPNAVLNLGLRISFAEIHHATNNFDPKLMIGRGGFGRVYKGMLSNGTKVAIKRSEPDHGQGFSEFQTEIVTLSGIRYVHLVSLIGYCDERYEMILVYEFMENGTLRDHLYSADGETSESASQSKLLWDKRLNICIDAAKGLHYLHTSCTRVIIHRDVKSTNILLDENYNAKVADFGLSHSVPVDGSHVSTVVKGSFGYLDPEYYMYSQLTQKSDVYSFGVVLLEVLCARPAVNPALPRDQISLSEWGLSWIRKGQLDKIVDPFLAGKINPNCLRKFGETLEKCLQECGAHRPNMVDVLWDLEYCLRLQHTASPAAVYDDSITTNVALGFPMPVFRRLPSDTVGGDEPLEYSQTFTEASQPNADQVFSQLKLGEAR